MIVSDEIEVFVNGTSDDSNIMCPHNQDSQTNGAGPSGVCDPSKSHLKVEPDARSHGTHKSHRSRCSSEYSCHSVHLERETCPHRGIYFGSDRRFEEEKQLLSDLVTQDKDFSVGDCDCKTQLVQRISGGSFGEVYLGRLKNTGEEVAVKLEPRNLSRQYLLHEGNVYRNLEGGCGIPRVHWFGLHGSKYSVLVMDLLGPTVQQLFAQCNFKLSLKSTLQLVDQMLSIMQHVHTHHFVHRDISPSNFMIGSGSNANKVYLIDFGHAKKLSTGFIPGRIRQNFVRPMVGTPRFASVFTHMGKEEARRDDLESLGYIWVYLLKGRLPWQGLQCTSHEEKLAKIANLKMTTPLETLCEGLPKEFADYLNYVRHLKVHDIPDYDQIKEFFRALGAREGISYNDQFDWSATTEAELQPPNYHLKEPSPLVTPISH